MQKAAFQKKKSAKIIQLDVFRHRWQSDAEKLINGFWNLAHAGLWPNQNFSDKEKESLKALIADHFGNGKSNKRTFMELAERVSLVKRYLQRKRGRYISKPQDWLNIHYPLGLSGTSAWLKTVNEIRKDVPEYNMGIQTFAKAVLSFIENPSKSNYTKWRNQLIAQKQFDLLQILNNTIIHIQYTS